MSLRNAGLARGAKVWSYRRARIRPGGTVIRSPPLPMRPSLLLLACLLASVCAFGDVVGEQPLSSPTYRPVDRLAVSSIASDGDSFLVVWGDLRDRGATYAAHINRDGTIADPRGMLLAKALSPIA